MNNMFRSGSSSSRRSSTSSSSASFSTSSSSNGTSQTTNTSSRSTGGSGGGSNYNGASGGGGGGNNNGSASNFFSQMGANVERFFAGITSPPRPPQHNRGQASSPNAPRRAASSPRPGAPSPSATASPSASSTRLGAARPSPASGGSASGSGRSGGGRSVGGGEGGGGTSGAGRGVPSPASPSDERQQQREREARFARQEAHNEAEAARRAGTPAPPGPPPASVDALASLPDVVVTKADVLDEANSTCCVCIDDFDEGGKATRLPCGHLLHRPCALRWLGRHCTCPTCRYELQSDDYIFEQGRPARMAAQRPRYRREALQSKSVHELRRLCAAVGVDSRGCLEKSDLVERLAASGRIEVFSDSPTSEGSQRSAAVQNDSGGGDSSSSRSDTGSGSSGGSFSGSIGVNSGSGGMSSPTNSSSSSSDSDSGSGVSSNTNSSSSSSSSSGSSNTGTNPEFTLAELEGMGVGALRQLMTILGGSANGLRPETCLEKSDMVQQIVDSGTVNILPEVLQPEGAEEGPPSEGAAAGAGAAEDETNTTATTASAADESAAATAMADAAIAALSGTASSEFETATTSPVGGATFTTEEESPAAPTAGFESTADSAPATDLGTTAEVTAVPVTAAAGGAVDSPASIDATAHEAAPSTADTSTAPVEGVRDKEEGELPIDEVLDRAMEEIETDSSPTATASGGGGGGGGASGPIVTLGELNALGIGALRTTMAEHGVDATGCVEKADLVQRLLASGTVRLVMDHEAVTAAPTNINQ